MTDSTKEPKEDGSIEESETTSKDEAEGTGETSEPSESDASADSDDDRDDESEEDEDESEEDEEKSTSGSNEPSKKGSSNALLIGVLCLGAGFGIGWGGHQFQTNKALKVADAAVQGEGEGARGPCKDWEKKLCDEFTETGFACTQAKGSSSLLSGSACAQALKSVDKTIDTIKAARASCTTLTDKLCGELGAETQTCGLVKTQTPSFPAEKCDEMMKNYDQVLQQLKMMEQRGAGMPPGHPGAGRPPGHPGGPPPGAVRVGPPGGGPPPGAPPQPAP